MQRGTKYNRLGANSSPIAESSVKAVSLKRNKTMKQEKIDAIRQAVHLVEEACQLVDSTMDDQAYDEGQYEAYGKYGFNQLLGNGNPYDGSLFTLIEKLEGQDND